MPVWIWDLAVVLIILFSAASAYHHGFFRSMVSLLGTGVSFLVGLMYSGPAARWCYANWLEEGVREGVREGIASSGTRSFETVLLRIDDILTRLPPLVSDAVRSQLKADSLEVWYENMIRANSGDVATALTEGVVGPIVTTVLQILAFCIIFLICSIVVRFAAGLLGRLRSVPVLGSVDGVAGALFGVARGVLYCFVLAAVLWLLIHLTGDRLPFVTQEGLSGTLLLRRFYDVVSSFGSPG